MNKLHILEEIKRTAKANGGKPLGKGRFYQETGTTESDWIGKHWARWSDALIESGFPPNQMQGAHETNELIEHFIGLMRELGKFPTTNEVKMKARRTPGFPWHTSFVRCFGQKHELAARVQAYCKDRDWHRRFEAKRRNGEWFDLGSADVNAFKRRKFM